MIHTLEADGIQLQFSGRSVLSDIYLRCETGKITGLLGRNGQGKSCLMQVIYGTLACQKSIQINGQPKPEAFMTRGLMVYMPQFHFIPRHLNLSRVFTDYHLDFASFEVRFPGFTGKHRLTIGALSSGDQRLLECYIVLKSTAQFALLDEPFTHLSPIQMNQLKELIAEEKRTKGILLTDHLFEPVIELSDYLYVLKNGKTHQVKDSTDMVNLGYVSGNF